MGEKERTGSRAEAAASILTLDRLLGLWEEEASGEEEEAQKRLEAEELRLVSTISHDPLFSFSALTSPFDPNKNRFGFPIEREEIRDRRRKEGDRERGEIEESERYHVNDYCQSQFIIKR